MATVKPTDPEMPEIPEDLATPDGGLPSTDISIMDDWLDIKDAEFENIRQGLEADLAFGEGQANLNRQAMMLDREIGQREIDQLELEGLTAAGNNARQRGIFQSGIRVREQEEVVEQAAVARADLDRGIAIGLQSLSLQVQKLRQDMALGLDAANIAITQQVQDFTNSVDSSTFITNPSAGGPGKEFNRDGKTVWSRGVGEAPDNKGNRNHPTYRARANFVSDFGNFVLKNFNVRSEGQHRALDADVNSMRSGNSDHYSDGAIDFSGSAEEIQRLYNYIKGQPWVSFVQIYPNGTLLHVSADINQFGGSADPSWNNPQTSAPHPGLFNSNNPRENQTVGSTDRFM